MRENIQLLAHVRLGNVLGREVLHVGVRLLCLLAIAVETNEAELGTTDQSWRNVGYANLLAVEIGAELLASNSLWQDELDRAQDMRKSSCHST